MPHSNPDTRARRPWRLRPLRRGLPWLLAAGLLGAVPALGAATATTSIDGTLARREALRAESRDDATAIINLAKGARVQVLFREGAWYRVEHAGRQGWIRLYWVRTGGGIAARALGPPASPKPSLSIAETTARRRARLSEGQVTASLGVRGLSEAALRGAQFDAEQVAKLDMLAVDAAAAARFAADGPLRGRSVDAITGMAGSRR